MSDKFIFGAYMLRMGVALKAEGGTKERAPQSKNQRGTSP